MSGYAAPRLGPGCIRPVLLTVMDRVWDEAMRLWMEQATRNMENCKRFTVKPKVKHKIGSVVNIRVPERFKQS